MNNQIYETIISRSKLELAYSCSNIISDLIKKSLTSKERCQISLSGGSTPSEAYKLLGKEKLEWSKVDILLGDERWVDQSNPLSNSYMLRNTLLSNSPGNQANFLPVPTTDCSSPKKSAALFQKQVQNICDGNPPVFDLILLGLGDDGHTASLFPGEDALNNVEDWVVNTNGKGLERITLTAPVLSSAKNVVFLVSGHNKKLALKRLLDPNESPKRTPAKLVNPSSKIIVLADADSTSD